MVKQVKISFKINIIGINIKICEKKYIWFILILNLDYIGPSFQESIDTW